MVLTRRPIDLTKLTEKRQEPHAPATGYTILWDDAVKGFGVRITADGAVAFIFNYRTQGGRLRRLTIGVTSEYTVETARKVAKRHRHVVDQGGDPLADWRASVVRRTSRISPTTTSTGTCRRSAPRAEDRRADPRQRAVAELGPQGHRDHLRRPRRHSPQDHQGRAAYRANRVVALLSKMFSLAIRKRWRGDNPAKHVERNQESKRARYLSNGELAQLTEALAAYPDRLVADAIRLLLLTGARRGEVLSMTWDQIDFEAGTWTKPGATTKQKTEHVVRTLAARSPAAGEDARNLYLQLRLPWPR